MYSICTTQSQRRPPALSPGQHAANMHKLVGDRPLPWPLSPTHGSQPPVPEPIYKLDVRGLFLQVTAFEEFAAAPRHSVGQKFESELRALVGAGALTGPAQDAAVQHAAALCVLMGSTTTVVDGETRHCVLASLLVDLLHGVARETGGAGRPPVLAFVHGVVQALRSSRYNNHVIACVSAVCYVQARWVAVARHLRTVPTLGVLRLLWCGWGWVWPGVSQAPRRLG